MASVSIRPVRTPARAEALRQGPLPPAPRPPAVGAAADLRADGSSSTAARTPASSTARPSTSSPSATASRSAGSAPRSTSRWDEYQGGKRRDVRLLRDGRRPRGRAGPARRRRPSGPPRRGRERILGPMDFTTNDEIGILIEGFERRPMILEPWHPPYYQRADRGGGLREGDGPADVGAAVRQTSRRASASTPRSTPPPRRRCEDEGIVIRNMRKREMAAEVRRFTDVYNEAWGDNWGFVPITDAEVEFQAKNLKQVLDEDWAYMAREGRRGRRRGAHAARHQPGDGEAERAPAALRLGQVPARQAQDRPVPRRSRSASSTSTATPASPPASTSSTSSRRRCRAGSSAARWAGSWRRTSR